MQALCFGVAFKENRAQAGVPRVICSQTLTSKTNSLDLATLLPAVESVFLSTTSNFAFLQASQSGYVKLQLRSPDVPGWLTQVKICRDVITCPTPAFSTFGFRLLVHVWARFQQVTLPRNMEAHSCPLGSSSFSAPL